MKKSSKYFELRWIVEVRWPENTWFEPIAAFNSESVAQQYASGCRLAATQGFEYRVQKRKSRGWG